MDHFWLWAPLSSGIGAMFRSLSVPSPGQFWTHLLDTGPLFPPPGWDVTSNNQSLEPREPKLQKARLPPSPRPWTGKQNQHHCWPGLVHLGSISIFAFPQAQQLSHTGWLPWLMWGLPEKGQRVPLDRDLSHPGSALYQLHDPRQLISCLRASLSSLANGGQNLDLTGVMLC